MIQPPQDEFPMIEIQSGTDKCHLLIKRETEKAYLLRGKCSEAWFPKSAIKDGVIQDWFFPKMSLVHGFCLMHPIK